MNATRKPLITADAVAERLGVSRHYVYDLAREKGLPSVRLGRKIRFDEEAVEAFIRSGGTAGVEP